jgi:DNA-binding PadR family transcriptional regulator
MTESPQRPVPIDIQSLSRSCNQALILATLSSGPHHGYQLVLELEEKSKGVFRFQHGTLYPILHKLENDGLISGDWLDERTRRRRKSYQLTAAGRQYLREQIASWRSFIDSFFQVVEEAEK